MGSIFSSPEPQFVPVPTSTSAETVEDPAIEEAARRARIAAAHAKGRKSTILTGAQGVLGEAPVTVKTLLGA